MRKLAIALAFVGCMLGFAATPANAQVGVYVGPGGVGVRIGDGHRHGGWHNGGRRYDDYRYNDRRWDNRRYDRDNYRTPQPITITVTEWRQVRTRYGWDNVPVRVRVVAYWDHGARSYVYRDSYGRRHYVNGY